MLQSRKKRRDSGFDKILWGIDDGNTSPETGRDDLINPFQLAFEALKREPREKLRIGEFERRGLDHLGDEKRVGHMELACVIAVFDDAVKNLSFALQPLVMKMRPLGRNDLRHFDEFGVLLQCVKGRTQIVKQEIMQTLGGAAVGVHKDMRQFFRGADRGRARDLLGNIELAGKISIEIARRHGAVFCNICHCRFAVAVMGKAFPSRLDNFLSSIIWSGHKRHCKPLE